MVLDETLPEMKWLTETKESWTLCSSDAHRRSRPVFLRSTGFKASWKWKQKNEELYNARTRTVLNMGNLPAFYGPEGPSGTPRQLMMATTQHLLFDVAKHVTQEQCDLGTFRFWFLVTLRAGYATIKVKTKEED